MNTQWIAQMNIDAINQMKQGKDSEAIIFLSETLRALLKEVGEPERLIKSSLHDDFMVSSHNDAFMMTTAKLSHIQFENYTATPIFNQAFVVQQQQISGRCIHPAVTECALLFNIGLACHRRSILTASSRLQQDAMRLYEKARETFEYHEVFQQSNGIYSTLLAAIYHNLFSIYTDTFQIPQAREIRFLLATLLSSHEAIFYIEEDQHSFFSVSLFCSASQDFRVAAAA